MAGPEPRNTVHAESAAQLHEKRYDLIRHRQGLFSITGSKPESYVQPYVCSFGVECDRA